MERLAVSTDQTATAFTQVEFAMLFMGLLTVAGSPFPAKSGKVAREARRMGCGKQDCVDGRFAVTVVQSDLSDLRCVNTVGSSGPAEPVAGSILRGASDAALDRRLYTNPGGTVSMRALVGERGDSMPHLRARALVRFVSACMLLAPILSCAQGPYYADSRCRAVEKLPDGSWLTRQPVMFGRSVRVGAGAIIYRTTVLNGIDLGAVLDKHCDPAAFYDVPPLVRF